MHTKVSSTKRLHFLTRSFNLGTNTLLNSSTNMLAITGPKGKPTINQSEYKCHY